MNLKKPFLWGLLLYVITILIDVLIVNGIIRYIEWEKSFFYNYLWDLYALYMLFLSMAMSLLLGNVSGIRIQVIAYISLYALMWVLLLYNYGHIIHRLAILRIVTTGVAHAGVLFLFIRKRVSPYGRT